MQRVGRAAIDFSVQCLFAMPNERAERQRCGVVVLVSSQLQKKTAGRNPRFQGEVLPNYFFSRNSLKCLATASAIDCSFFAPPRCLLTE